MTDQLDEFTRAYLECALWSTVDGDDLPLDASYDFDDIAPEAMQAAIRDCAEFQKAQDETIAGPLQAAGHDFWLTRNGHGAGFWDGDWPPAAASILTDASKAFGTVEPYLGDDGKLYGFGNTQAAHTAAVSDETATA